MKTAFRILARDLGRLARNPVALIVIAGLIVLPALYAWYCVWANWDPYGNTGNIRVAVANADVGADTEALGHIDVGSQVEANLQDDDQLGWEFVSEDEFGLRRRERPSEGSDASLRPVRDDPRRTTPRSADDAALGERVLAGEDGIVHQA